MLETLFLADENAAALLTLILFIVAAGKELGRLGVWNFLALNDKEFLPADLLYTSFLFLSLRRPPERQAAAPLVLRIEVGFGSGVATVAGSVAVVDLYDEASVLDADSSRVVFPLQMGWATLQLEEVKWR
jgi:hypothetical protein